MSPMTETTATPIDPEFGTEEPLPGTISLDDFLASLEQRKTALEETITEGVEKRARLNAQLAEDRAQLVARAQTERDQINEDVKQAREELKRLTVFLNAANRKPRVKKAEK